VCWKVSRTPYRFTFMQHGETSAFELLRKDLLPVSCVCPVAESAHGQQVGKWDGKVSGVP
jgi:hypothetical protein